MPKLEAKTIDAMKAGSMDAFAEMVRTYQSRVRTFLGGYLHNPDVVDDLAQETFIQAFKAAARYNPDASLCSWLLGIGRNLALNYLRKEKHRRLRDHKWWEGREEIGLNLCQAADPAQSEERIRALAECVEGLPANNARIVRGFYYEGVKGDNLAEKLGISTNALRQRLARIREALHHCVTVKLEAISGDV